VLFTVFRWFRRLVYLVVLVLFVYLVVTSAQVVVASRSPLAFGQVKPAAAIVVIGTATSSTPLTADLKLRCQEAVSLYRAKRAAKVFTTADPSVAAYLRAHGIRHVTLVPASDIPGQLRAAARLLPSSAGGKVIIVADPLQTKWLQDLATAEHLHAQIAAVPAPKGSFWHDVGTIWGQSVAVALGRFVGYENTGWIGG
jgi:hypothetical protein